MAGIYIHIPFCKQKCSYCDFHFSTSLKHKSNLIEALIKEIELKKGHLTDSINTIYFGGGTPSLLTQKELASIIDALYKNYKISNNIEFTLECNPDDLSPIKLQELKSVGINRLSIGIQSFFNDDLTFFNRAHNASQAESCIKLSQDSGFDNLTVDLIYGTPILTDQKWEENLNQIARLNIPHLSAYALTIEPQTALYHSIKKGLIIPKKDEKTIEQFKTLIEFTKANNLHQYEISNFAKDGFISQHNSNYWKGIEYLGFGPSAHSFIQNKRLWNVSNNIKYISALKNNSSYFEEEIIDETTAYNEYILTRLRTTWGINLNHIRDSFNATINTHFSKELQPYINSKYLHVSNEEITLTNEGIFIADKITSDLFIV